MNSQHARYVRDVEFAAIVRGIMEVYPKPDPSVAAPGQLLITFIKPLIVAEYINANRHLFPEVAHRGKNYIMQEATWYCRNEVKYREWTNGKKKRGSNAIFVRDDA